MVVFADEPTWDQPTASTGSRPQKRLRLAEGTLRPISLDETNRCIVPERHRDPNKSHTLITKNAAVLHSMTH